MANKKANEKRPGSLIPEKSLQHFSGDHQTCQLKVFIKTFGCQMNVRDSEALLGLFLDKGYSKTDSLEDADIILVNTCSVREHAEQRAISFLGSLKKFYERRKTRGVKPKVIGLIGCMAVNRGEEIFKKMSHVNLVCGPGCLEKIIYFSEKIKRENIQILEIGDQVRSETFYESNFRNKKNQAQIVISTGCSNYCAYCVVPYVRGKLRLRMPDDIINEINRNIVLGIKKITLLGQNVNDYNFSLNTQYSIPNTNFVGLLKIINDIDGLEELDFISSNPKNTTVKLFKLMAESKIIKKHLHLPFQSGSNRILKKMKRGYTREKYLKIVGDYKRIVNGTLSTDVIVGFPGETEADFQQTKDILDRVKFKNAYIFKYSPRPGTIAGKMIDDVPIKVKIRRHKELLDLQKKISLRYR